MQPFDWSPDPLPASFERIYKNLVKLVNGSEYEGEWSIKGQMQGRGTLWGSDGSVYTGYFENGKPHGRGLLIYPNSDFYNGEFF